ncbi:MAG: SIMPL domain-containing protein, partial [Mesorhizobium sp.]|nr:SIMPL domain-containing protein [Mesorhizobium sp.]
MFSKSLALPLAVMLAAVPLAASAQTTDSDTRTLTIVGEGRASAAPDIAMTTLTVLRNAQTAADATKQANDAVAAVTSAMRELGIEGRDLQTVGFSINPQYQYDNRQDGQPANPPKIVGYEVRNSLSVRVRDISKVGEVLDKAISLGVNQGGDINFTLDNPAPLADAARRDAIAKARATAEVMAEAADLGLGDILAISEET